MYEHHFGFHGKPFQSALPERAFFQSKSLRQIIPVMLHTLRSDSGVAVLTGPAGIGKSALLKHLQRCLLTDGQAVVFSAAAVRTAGGMLGLLQRRLQNDQTANSETRDVSTNSGTAEHWQVIDRLARTVDFWGPLIVLLDDAHLAGPEVFAELRALLEEEVDGRRLVRVLICGALSLEDVLAVPAMTDFVQKIRSHVFPEALRSNEAVTYLATHLKAVGGELRNVFQSDAVERIVMAADGVPHCLNLLADESLLVTREAEATVVTAPHVDQALRRLRHLPYTWNVSVADNEDATAYENDDCATTGTTADPRRPAASESSMFSQNGVIEIGAPLTTESGGEQQTREHDTVATAHNGVIEIGAVADAAAVAELDEPVSAPPEIDTKQQSVVLDTLPVAFMADDYPDATEFEAQGFLDIDLETFSDHEIGDGEYNEELDVSDTELQPSARLDADFEPIPQPAIQPPTLNDFEPWCPPGAWSKQPATSPQSESPDHLETPTAWVKLPRGITPMPVFDRYTWLEYGREVPFGDAIGRRLVDVPTIETAWPPSLIGVAPAVCIPVEDHSEGFTAIGIQMETLATGESAKSQHAEPPRLEAANVGSPDESEPEVSLDALFPETPDETESRDQSELRDHDLLPAATQFADTFELSDLTQLHPLEFDEADGPLTVPDSPEEIAETRMPTPLLQPIAPFEAHPSTVAEPAPAIPQPAPPTESPSPPAIVAALEESALEEPEQRPEWHDGQLLDGSPVAEDDAESSDAAEEVVSLPIKDAVVANTDSSGETTPADQREAATGPHVAHSQSSAAVDRLFTLPLQINELNLSRRDGAYSDLEPSPVTEALLRLDGDSSQIEECATRRPIVEAAPTSDDCDSEQTARQPQSFVGDTPETACPDGRMTRESKLRFETLFTRLRQRTGR